MLFLKANLLHAESLGGSRIEDTLERIISLDLRLFLYLS
jgi:hypothetical protein